MGLRDQIDEASEVGAKVKELEKIRKETEELRGQLEEMSGEVNETLGAQIKESKDLLTEMLALLKATTRAIRPNPAESEKKTMQALNQIIKGLKGVQKEAASAKSAVASTRERVESAKEEAKAMEGRATLATQKLDEARWGGRITTAIWAATAMLLTLVIGTAIVWSTSNLSRKFLPQDLRLTEKEMETMQKARRENRAYQGLTEEEQKRVDRMLKKGIARMENQESR